MEDIFTSKLIKFKELDHAILQKFMEEKGLDQRSWSAAVRMIIREWNLLRPTLFSAPPVETGDALDFPWED